MRRPLVAGNWKMNGNRAGLTQLAGSIARLLDERTGKQGPAGSVEALLFPPYVYLSEVAAVVQGSQLAVGAQDADHRDEGAVTGAVAAAMLKDVGCTHLLVGHSERRQLFGEQDEQVALKFAKALEAGLTPIVCVGESLAQRQAGQTLDVVRRQLSAVTDAAGLAGMAKGMVAYEPVWAIGTGQSASPEQAEEVHLALREALRGLSSELADTTRILYGGSVTPRNAALLLSQSNIDGALVGGASLDAESFVAVCQAADGSLEG